MNFLRNALTALLIVALFSCNHQQSNTENGDTTLVRKSPTEKTATTKPGEASLHNFNRCDSLVTLILKTSPRYIELTKGLNEKVIKNGGQSFGVSMEGSPNHAKDNTPEYSKTYNFTIYEMYPDRQLNTARFSFDPRSNKLYEYDVVNDKQIPVEYDHSLLVKYEALCK